MSTTILWSWEISALFKNYLPRVYESSQGAGRRRRRPEGGGRRKWKRAVETPRELSSTALFRRASAGLSRIVRRKLRVYVPAQEPLNFFLYLLQNERALLVLVMSLVDPSALRRCIENGFYFPGLDVALSTMVFWDFSQKDPKFPDLLKWNKYWFSKDVQWERRDVWLLKKNRIRFNLLPLFEFNENSKNNSHLKIEIHFNKSFLCVL